MSNQLSNATSQTKTRYVPPQGREPITRLAVTRNTNGSLILFADPNLDAMLNCTNTCTDVPETVTNAMILSFQGSALTSRDSRTSMLGSMMSEEGWRFCPCFKAQRTHAHALMFFAVQVGVANAIADRQLATEVVEQAEWLTAPA